MPLATNVTGATSGNVAEVDSNNQLKVVLPTTIALAGYDAPVFEIDPGTITGTPTRRETMVTRDSRQSMGMDTGIFDYFFSAAAQDTGIWKYTFTTMTASQSGGFLLLNANSTATTTTGASLATWRSFGFESRGGLRIQTIGMVSVTPVANQIVECGLFIPTATTAPADGVYFRITSAGLIGCVNYNGTETTSGVLITPAVATAQVLDIVVTTTGTEFWINGVLGTILVTPAGDGQPFLNLALPYTVQQRNSGAVSGTQMQFKVASVHVSFVDMQLAMPLSHQAAVQGLTCQQATAGGTMGSTEFFANNLAAGAGFVLTNTTAAAGTGLGGQFGVQPTFAAGSDGILCSYQVPVGSITAKPRIFMCTGVKIHGAVTTALVGGPVTYAYSLAFGQTALSMLTAESATFTGSPSTKAPRRVALGFETYAATAAVGVLGSPAGVYMAFNAPIATNPGEFIAVCAKNLGVVTSAGVINVLVTFDGYWV